MEALDIAREDLDRREAEAKRLRDKANVIVTDALTAASLAEQEPDIRACSQSYAESLSWFVRLIDRSKSGVAVSQYEAMEAAKSHLEAWSKLEDAIRKSHTAFLALDLARRAGEADREARHAEQARDFLRKSLGASCSA